MTVAISINPYAVFYLPAWVVHPTIISTDDFLFNRKPAEQAGGAKGWRPAKAGRVGILQQHDGIARSAINVCCLRCEAPKPSITYYNDIISNNDIKWHDNLNDGTEDANHNGRIDGDNGDGIYSLYETWYETNPNKKDSDGDTFEDYWEIQKGYNPKTTDSDDDTILDNEEDTNGNGIRDGTESSAILKDTDEDGLNDFMEINGWTVVTYKEATMEKIDEYTVTSKTYDPDSDDDGLNDFFEFQNQTDPNKDDTDGDGFLDLAEIEDGTLPFGREGIPPMITYYNDAYAIRTKMKGLKLVSNVILKIWVDFEDNYYMDHVWVDVVGLNEKDEETGMVKESSHYFEWEMGYEKAVSHLFNSFELEISARDKNENKGTVQIKTKSISEYITGEILGKLEAFLGDCDFLEKILKRIYKEILKTFMTWLFNIIDEKIGSYVSSQTVLMSDDEEEPWDYSYDTYRTRGISELSDKAVEDSFSSDNELEKQSGVDPSIGIDEVNFGLFYFDMMTYVGHFIRMIGYYISYSGVSDPFMILYYILAIMEYVGIPWITDRVFYLRPYPHYLQWVYEGGCAMTTIIQAYDYFNGFKDFKMPLTTADVAKAAETTFLDVQDGMCNSEIRTALDNIGIYEGSFKLSNVGFDGIREEIKDEKDPVIVGYCTHETTTIGYIDIGYKYLIMVDTNSPWNHIVTYKYFRNHLDGTVDELMFTTGQGMAI